MKVLILSWEFPPRIIGELGAYVDRLVHALLAYEVDVYVVTFQDGGDGSIQGFEGIKVSRVANPVRTHINLLTWDLTLMTEFERASSNIYYSVGGNIDLIDANEWICVPAATVLKRAFDIPFIYTLHSLEEHRSNFANEPLNIAIRNLEHLGLVEARHVLVKSKWMKSEVVELHGGYGEKIVVVPIDSSNWIEEVIKSYEKSIRS